MKVKMFLAAMASCAVAAVSLVAPASAAEIGKASINGQIGTATVDENTANAVCPSVDGDAQYSVSLKTASATSISSMSVKIGNLTTTNYPNLKVTVDSVKVDGNEISGAAAGAVVNTSYLENGVGKTRIVLTNTVESDGALVEAVPSTTAIQESVEVLFTVSGTGLQGTTNVTDPAVTTTTAALNGAVTTTTTIFNNPIIGAQTTQALGAAGQTSGGGNVNSASTGDAGVAGIAIAGLAVCGIAAFMTRRKK